ncbi:hypothetical protein FACS1894172_12350 [Spirochaetia bacterium]|nr:hypothetical protein FACS1894164_05320 [Spirochaetia bacterium]GHU33566.1 hypothetical protein FACS1894172_12350 [Spirochaetia bacterium]
MNFLYETHLHTSPESACAVAHGPDYVQGYIDAGYTGIIVTNHFFRGNTGLDRSLPWAEWVKQFYRGYEDTYNEGLRRGLDVFFGWEETYDDSDDYLVYGLDKEWLLNHPEAKHWTRREQYEQVHLAGGCVVQAHPFRQVYYISEINLSPYLVDAVEVANGGNEQSFDALAFRYAQKNGLPMTAGSDIHSTDQLQSSYLFGVYLPEKIQTIHDYVNAARKKTIVSVRTIPGRLDVHGDEIISLPVFIKNAEGNDINSTIEEFLA